MSITGINTGLESVQGQGPERPKPDPAEILRKRVYIGFTVSVAVGLMVAAIYVEGRVAGHEVRPAKAATTVAHVSPAPTAAAKHAALGAQPAPKPVATPKQVAAPKQVASVANRVAPAAASAPKVARAQVESGWTLTNPHPGDRYLQIIALGPTATNAYVPKLRAEGLHPVVAPAEEPRVYRILIGPFADVEAFKSEQQKLESEGFQPMVRKY